MHTCTSCICLAASVYKPQSVADTSCQFSSCFSPLQYIFTSTPPIFLHVFANSSQLLTRLITEGSPHLWTKRQHMGPDISFLTPNWTTLLKSLDLKWPWPCPKSCCFYLETFKNTPRRKLSHPFVPPSHSFMALITKAGVKYLLDERQFYEAYCVSQKSHHWKEMFLWQILEVG